MADNKVNAIIMAGTHRRKKRLIDEYDGQGPKNKALLTQITGKSLILNSLDALRKSKYINQNRSEEHTSELQSHSFISYAVFCLKKKKNQNK